MNVPAFRPGDELPTVQIEPISRRTLALFAGASGDHQPVHIDIEEAHRRGRADVFAHGMLSMAYLSRVVMELAPQERIRALRARFTAITPVYAELAVSGRVAEVTDGVATLEFSMTLADGTGVVVGDAEIDCTP